MAPFLPQKNQGGAWCQKCQHTKGPCGRDLKILESFRGWGPEFTLRHCCLSCGTPPAGHCRENLSSHILSLSGLLFKNPQVRAKQPHEPIGTWLTVVSHQRTELEAFKHHEGRSLGPQLWKKTQMLPCPHEGCLPPFVLPPPGPELF